MEHLHLRILSIRQETPVSKSYTVEAIDNKTILYKAGQFFTLLVTLHGKEVRRSYSISSTPGVDETIFFTIKRIENGELSRHLFDHLKTGDIVTSLPPTGRFTIETPDCDTAVFIAAGSGITPVFSLIKHLLYQFDLPKVLLINQNRNEAESIFRNELLELEKTFTERFQMVEVFSHPLNHTRRSQRLNNSLLEHILLQNISMQRFAFISAARKPLCA